MKIAIIADWLTTYGGAEHTICEFLALYPHAPIFTTVAKRDALGPLKNADIYTTYLQKWYKILGKHQLLLPWMPQAVESIDLTKFDVILSSSHAVAKGIIPPSHAIHVCYCHTPMRYAWEMENEYLEDFHIPLFLRPRIKRELKKLRRWDLATAKRVDVFLANSTETQERIEKIYARESVVVAPPVDDRFFLTSSKSSGNYYLAVGRLVPYKKFDLLIEVANHLKLPLKIAGKGQEESRLKKMAGPTVEFLGFVPDEDLPNLYARADAFLFPPHEDAGIAPREAQATGTPVIAFGKGGIRDTIIDRETGILFDEQSPESLIAAIETFRKKTWDRDRIREHAKAFSKEHFRRRIKEETERAVVMLSLSKHDR